MTQWHDLPDIVRLFAALALVIALMGGLSFILRKFGMPGTPSVPQNRRRLKIVESLSLDARRRAVLLQCDDKQHLVILGANGETIVKTDIEPVSENE